MITRMADFSDAGMIDYTNADRLRFCLDLHEYVQARIYCFDYYERDSVAAFRAQVGPGDVVVDVGANIGQYSLLAARLVGSGGRVIAFEADPGIVDRLRRHVAINRLSVDVTACALGDANATRDFYPSAWAGNQGQGSLLPAEPARQRIRKREALRVKVCRLDDVMAQKGVFRIDFLKIDVEGYEMHVLRGAQHMLEAGRIGAIMVELSPTNLAQAGESPASIRDCLTAYGYRPFTADAAGRLHPLSLPVQGDINAFFLRQEG